MSRRRPETCRDDHVYLQLEEILRLQRQILALLVKLVGDEP